MGVLITRPSTTISAGNWSVTDANIPGTINDQNDITLTNNTSQNEQFVVNLDDVPSELSSVNFTGIQFNVRAKRSGKGNATFEASVTKPPSTAVVELSQVVSNDGLADHSSNNVSINFNADTVNDLFFVLDTTDGTQVFISEVSVTLTYTDPTNGILKLNNGLIQLTSGKITL